MSDKSWQIDRRRMLIGSGTALALPMLDGMLYAHKRHCRSHANERSLYFPYGVQMSGEYAWFPKGGQGFYPQQTVGMP